MVQTSSLRRDNKIVFTPTNELSYICSVDEIYKGCAKVLYQNGTVILGEDEMHGIPLTSSILVEACGFSKRDNGTSIDYHIGINHITNDWLFYLVWIDWFQYPFYKNSRHEIKYLHQLMNLYFSLTGEELPINREALANIINPTNLNK